MLRRLVPLAVLALVALPACKKKDDPGAASSAKAEDRARGQVKVLVDGEQVAVVDAGRASTFVPLGVVVPADRNDPRTWRAIEVRTRDGETRTIDAPMTTHPGLVPGLFLDRGQIALGFFAPEDLARHGKAQVTIGGLAELRILIAGGAGGAMGGRGGGDGEGGGAEDDGERPALTAAMVITVVAGGTRTPFRGDQLAALPTSTAPIGDTTTPGWTLNQILEATGARPAGQVVVYGSEGANLVLEPADLDPERAKLHIKLNRQGQLRFRVFRKAGSAWEVGGELRGLSEVVVK